MSESMLNTEPEYIQVAVGLVFDAQYRILIGCRAGSDIYTGKWEFPGGKIMARETVADAIKRELQEEVGIVVNRVTPYMNFTYDYPDRNVALNFMMVDDYQGQPTALEHQSIRWANISQLGEIDMLTANRKVVEKLMGDNNFGLQGRL